MLQKKLLLEKISKNRVEVILGIIGVISLILTIVNLELSEFKIEAAISAGITILVIVSIYSILLYKRETAKQTLKRKYPIVIRIIWNYTIVIAFSIFNYRFFLCNVVIQYKNYWIYSFIVFYIIVSLTIKYIIKFLKERKKLIEEKAGLLEHGFNIVFILWVLLYLNISAFGWFYIPKKTIDLSNAHKPCYLPVYVEGYRKLDLFEGHSSIDKIITIKDEKLLESFTMELSKVTAEKVHGIDYLNHEILYEKELHYLIMPDYKDSSGNYIHKDFDKMLFPEMKLYRNGELILIKHRSRVNFLMPFYNAELYKVNLSQELTAQILELVD